MKRRWMGTIAEGKVFAKTGTLIGYSKVVGYLTDSLVPLVLLNDYDGDRIPILKVRQAQNKMVLHWFQEMKPESIGASSKGNESLPHGLYLLGLE
ncbi:MAG: hypothetical protein KA715_14590 [Xanthomonadaceae bacterium]|nr:hypothetical protein [Xanthomonadaceae bacterium]